jgi:N6-L-threonylcarbamoyladenine synthase
MLRARGAAFAIVRGGRLHLLPVRTAATAAGATTPSPLPYPRRCIIGIESTCDDSGVAVLAYGGPLGSPPSSPPSLAPPTSTSQAHPPRLLANVTASQHALTVSNGGVVPTLAAREHERNLPVIIRAALEAAGPSAVPTAVAVAAGPGLAPCLRAGVAAACELAARLGVPVLPVHHLEAHMLVARMSTTEGEEGFVPPSAEDDKPLHFPFLSLLVSGGHTALGVCVGVGRHIHLGGTLDDSLGEAFDKVARALGAAAHVSAEGARPVAHLGAALELLAREGRPGSVPLPRPLSTGDHVVTLRNALRDGMQTPAPRPPTVPGPWRFDARVCALSLSGLKSSVHRFVEREAAKGRARGGDGNGEVRSPALPRLSLLPRAQAADLAASFQAVAVAHVCEQVDAALTWCAAQRRDPRSGLFGGPDAAPLPLVVCGGVASNARLRSALAEVAGRHGADLRFPPPALCVDNGAMIAWAGLEQVLEGGTAAAAGAQLLVRAGTERDERPHYFFEPRWKLGTPLLDVVG